MVKKCWRAAGLEDVRLQLSQLGTSQEVVIALLEMKEYKKVNSVMLMWAWWDAMTKANAGEGLPEIEAVLKRATLMTTDVEVVKPLPSQKQPRNDVPWKPLEMEILKVNIDGAYLKSNNTGAWGYVV